MSRKIVGPRSQRSSRSNEAGLQATDARSQSTKPEATPVLPADPPRERVPVEERPDRSNEPQKNETFGSEFLDNVAHQMVAPLQTIEMTCQNIIAGYVPAEDQALRLKEIMGHARILADFARRMRFLHELVSGKVIDTETLTFERVTTAWIDGFNNYRPQFDLVNINVDIATKKMNRLPEVISSRLATQQVIMNLYDNALKYGRARATVTASVDKPYVINEFSHVARIKLTPSAAANMFERGFRAPEARALRGSGSGIGMWISKKLMSAMQGDLRAFPTDDDNVTRFKLYWRIYQ